MFFKPEVDTVSGAVIKSGGSPPYATSIKWAHTVSANKGTNRIMIVEVGCDTFPDSIAYAGRNLVPFYDAANGKYKAQVWYLVDPPAGKDSVAVYFPTGSGTNPLSNFR